MAYEVRKILNCPNCGRKGISKNCISSMEPDTYLGHNKLRDGKTYAIVKCGRCGCVAGREL